MTASSAMPTVYSLPELIETAEHLLIDGQVAAAVYTANQALQLNAFDPGALHIAGLAALRAGDAANATLHLQQALTIRAAETTQEPALLAALAADVGSAHYAAGRVDAAVLAWDQSLAWVNDAAVRQWRTEAVNMLTRLSAESGTPEARANQVAARYMLAALARAAGSWIKAANHLREALELDPTNLDCMNAFIVLARDAASAGANASTPIVGVYRAYLRTHPDSTSVRLALALALYGDGRQNEALLEIERVIDGSPEQLDALAQYATALADDGRFDMIGALLQASALRHSTNAERLHDIGRVYLHLSGYDAALAMFDQALAINPQHARAMAGRGAAYDGLKSPGPAMRAYMSAAGLAPSDRWVTLRLTRLLTQYGAYDAIRLISAQYLGLVPDDALMLACDALVIPTINDDIATIGTARGRAFEKLAALADRPLSIPIQDTTLLPLIFDFTYHGRDNLDLARRVSSLYLRACPALQFVAAHTTVKRSPNRLRIGILSSHLLQHTIGRLNRGLISQLDRSRFELVVIRPFVARHDDWSKAMDAAADAAVVLPRSIEAAQQTLAGLELDVLFFPDIGMDAYSYIFAYGRYARVQAVSWGHPDTTGIPNLDYFISSKRLEAPGAQAHYTERLVQLSNLPAYYPRPTAVGEVNRGKYGFMRDAKLYGCPQSLFKFHPEFDALLAGILRADPKGVVVIPAGMPAWRELLRSRMKNSMADVIHRVRFIDQVPEAQFLEFLKMMDVLLDPIHFGAGNTAYEAMSVGTPTVTWPGEFMRARVTAGAYDQMGFRDLIAHDAAGYIERAVRVANDDAYRAQCVGAIEAGSQKIFDDSSFVREFEAFCVEAYARS